MTKALTSHPDVVKTIAPEGEAPGVEEIIIKETTFQFGFAGFFSKTITHSLALSNIVTEATFIQAIDPFGNTGRAIYSARVKRGTASGIVEVQMFPTEHHNWNFHLWSLLGAVKDTSGTPGIEANQITFGAVGQAYSAMQVLCRMIYREGLKQSIEFIP